jgi:ADP-heptose:LPS heptosyltransferase
MFRKIKNAKLRRIVRSLRKYSFISLNIIFGLIFNLIKKRKRFKPDMFSDFDWVNKILVIRTNRIGDVILTTPIFRALKDKFPAASLSVLVHAETREIIENNKFIDEVVTINNRGIWLFLREGKVIRSLKNEKFDLVFVMHPAIWCNLLSFLIRPKLSIGFDCYGSGWLLDKSVFYIYNEHRYARLINFKIKHEIDSNLDLVNAVGIDMDNKQPFIEISPEKIEKMSFFLKENGFKKDDLIALVHPASKEPQIRWKKEGFSYVADRLIDNGIKVIILEGPGERGVVEDVVKRMNNKPVIARNLSLGEVAALTKLCHVFLGNSTGPAHIASAVNVPTVTIMGIRHPSDSSFRWRPLGPRSVVLENNIGCKVCYPSECRHYLCINGVKEEEVLKNCLRLIGEE